MTPVTRIISPCCTEYSIGDASLLFDTSSAWVLPLKHSSRRQLVSLQPVVQYAALVFFLSSTSPTRNS